jgi:uncharacterized membrane protein
MLIGGRRPAMRRLTMSLGAGLVAALVLPWFTSWELATVTSWSISGLVFIGGVVPLVLRADGGLTMQVSTVEDDSRASAGLLLVASSTTSLIGVGLALYHASKVGGAEQVLTTAVGTLTVVVSWFVVHLVFTLKYAHLYYSPPVGGVELKGSTIPDYRDFAYLSFTVGMTFQVSDTDLHEPDFRRVVLAQSLLSYLFGAVILAATVNVVASFVK